MTDKNRGWLYAATLSAAATAVVFWLGSEFRPSGVLGALQGAVALLCMGPYILGAVLAGSPHSPSPVGFALGLFVEFFILVALALFVRRRIRARRLAKAAR